MSKLIDKLRYRFFDKRRDGYLDGSPGVGNRKWMFARCSGIHDGFVPAISLPAVVEDECYLSGVNPQRIPLWWIERKFIKGIMARLKGLDVLELVPENTSSFERKMSIRANVEGGDRGVLVYVSSDESSNVICVSDCEWLLNGLEFGYKVRKSFNNKLKVDSVMINIPFKDPSILKMFLRNFDGICNQISQNIVNLDKKQ